MYYYKWLCFLLLSIFFTLQFEYLASVLRGSFWESKFCFFQHYLNFFVIFVLRWDNWNFKNKKTKYFSIIFIKYSNDLRVFKFFCKSWMFYCIIIIFYVLLFSMIILAHRSSTPWMFSPWHSFCKLGHWITSVLVLIYDKYFLIYIYYFLLIIHKFPIFCFNY